jgi:hypothetical protein
MEKREAADGWKPAGDGDGDGDGFTHAWQARP